MDAIASHLWQSTIVAAAAGALAWLFRGTSASVRYWIWFAAALKFLVPFAALAAIASFLPLPDAPRSASGALDAAAVVFRTSALPEMPIVFSSSIAVLWMAGTCIVLFRSFAQWRELDVHARHSPSLGSGIVHDTLRRVERGERITRPIAIVDSARSMEPGVIGIWRPVLVWPRRLTAGLSEAHIEAIAAHEVCHVVRRDNLLAVAQIAVTAAFWFYPVVWWIGARLIDERERACDEHVLARGRAPAAYAESILKTCQFCLPSPAVSVAGVTGGLMKARIIRIMKNAPASPMGLRHKLALTVAAVLTLLVPVIGTASRPVMAAPQDADREVHRPGGNVTSPRLLREVKPQYTPRAMQEKAEGEVLMECVIKADGTVGDIKIVKPLHEDLDKAATDAAAQWVFEPGTRDGKPVAVLVTIAIAFTLK